MVLEPRDRARISRRRRLAANQGQSKRSPSPRAARRPDAWGTPPTDPRDPRSSQIERSSTSSDRPDLQHLSRRRRNGASPRDSFNLRNVLANEPGRAGQAANGRNGGQRYPVPTNRNGQSSAPTLSRSPETPLDPRPAVIPINGYQRNTQTARPNTGLTGQTAPGTVPQRRRLPQSRPRPLPKPLVYLVRLLIFGVGIGAILGTTLSIVNPTARQVDALSQATLEAPAAAGEGNPLVAPESILSAGIQLGQEMTTLRSSMQGLVTAIPELRPGVFLVDLYNGAYLDINGAASFPAASTIKVPVLVAFLQDVDSGKIKLDEMITMQAEDVAEGSGDMQYQPVGTQYSALETAELMIVISDNTATNMLIRRMGGMEALNQRFRSWGMTTTVLRNPLADLSGTNTTSPRELTELLVRISQGELLSLRSRDRLMEIMQGTVTDTLIPAGTGDERAVIAHKTGTIDNMVGDTGIVDLPNGKRYVLTVLVERPIDDSRAQELIRQICQEIYRVLSAPASNPAPPPAPASSPAIP